ncbi:MAG: preprotein translocase subunit SecE [Defluviitaleaceae bacterium]|nr:preprotein translocase subunit SecE [Defluviitaleaceae bacterium]
MEKEKKATLGEKLVEYKAEFKRIQWLTPAELRKKTMTVIGVCIVFLVIIFCYDFIFTEIMSWISRIVA